MITKLREDEYAELVPNLMKDPLRNYYNLLGLYSSKRVHDSIFIQHDNGDIVSILFKRMSGALKFYAPGDYDSEEMRSFLKKLDFKALISPQSYCRHLDEDGVFSSRREGSQLAKLRSLAECIQIVDLEMIRALDFKDLNEAAVIYSKVFKSYASMESMDKRLRTNRGRAFGSCINNKLVSVVQTDFETPDIALIVGVATDPNYQNRGFATRLLYFVLDKLVDEGKEVFLEYEGPAAGSLYKKLGFELIDATWHYMR